MAITFPESCQGLATAGPYSAWLHGLPESAATDCVQSLKEAGPGGRKIRHFSIKIKSPIIFFFIWISHAMPSAILHASRGDIFTRNCYHKKRVPRLPSYRLAQDHSNPGLAVAPVSKTKPKSSWLTWKCLRKVSEQLKDCQSGLKKTSPDSPDTFLKRFTLSRSKRT